VGELEVCAQHLLLALAFFTILIWRKALLKRVQKTGNPGQRRFLVFFIRNIKLELGDWRKTVFLAAASAIFVVLSVAWLFGVTPSYDASIPIFLAVVLAPVSEQFLLVLLLLLGLYVLERLCSRRGLSFKHYELLSSVYCLLFSAFILAAYHGNFSVYSLVARFASFLLFGGLWMLSKRNFLPAIVAHSATNLFLFLVTWLALTVF